MKKIVLFAMGLVLSGTALAQDKVETTIKADFVNEYIKPLGSIFLNMLKFIVIALFFGVAMVHSGEAGEPA